MSYLQSKLPEFSPAVVVEPWRKALMDAAELIRARGLAKWARCDAVGAVCVQGAITCAIEGDPDGHDTPLDRRATAALAAYLRSRGVSETTAQDGGCGIWNNQPERTATEVIAALEAAARS